jgi:Spy/CpxP family protein refolding chaperone
MRKGILIFLTIVSLGFSTAQAQVPKGDVFKGKLFAPNIIMEHQVELNLTKQQFTEIRAAVVEVQAGVAGHEWDMREAYQALMLELDQSPIDEAAVLKLADKALSSENQVKKTQMAMLIRLKNLLTAEQVDYLESVVADK